MGVAVGNTLGSGVWVGTATMIVDCGLGDDVSVGIS